MGPAGAVDIAAVINAGAMTESRAKEILNEINIEESAAPDHVRVATARPSGRGGFDITLQGHVAGRCTPRDDREQRNLKATDMRGHVKAMIVNGGVELSGMTRDD